MLGQSKKINSTGTDSIVGRHPFFFAILSISVLCLCLAGMLGFSPSSADTIEFEEGDFYYETNTEPENTVTLTGLVDETKTSITIPGKVTHEGTEYTVTAIDDYAFYLLYDLKCDIVIPANVTEIGTKAFEGAGIISLSFEANSKLETIGYRAFNGCSKITGAITIPSSVKLIDEVAFNKVTMSSLVFQESSTELDIGSSAFSGCGNITSLTIPANVVSIGSTAFSGCTALESVTFINTGAKLKTLDKSAFSGCTKLTGNVEFPSSLETIGKFCFKNCAVTSISFAEGSVLKSIGDYAFSECSALAGSIEFPSTIEEIGKYSFSKTGITGITFKQPANNDTKLVIDDGAFGECKSLSGAVSFPSSLSAVNKGAFCRTAITSVIFDDDGGPETIGELAFGYCESLAELKITKGTKTLEFCCFYQTGLTGLDLTDATDLETIGERAFMDCTSMHIENLTIPDSLIYIEDGAFSTGPQIDKLTFGSRSNLTILGEMAFSDCGIEGTLKLPNSLEQIGQMCFAENDEITSLVIDINASHLVAMLDDSFSGCSISGVVNIPATMVNFGSQVFQDNGKITYVVSEDNPVYSAVNGNLMSKDKRTIVSAPCATGDLVIGSEIIAIGDGAFSGTDITSVTLNEGLATIGKFAFYGCDQLRGEIAFPSTVRTIGAQAFAGTNISSIRFAPGSVLESIGYKAFYDLGTLGGDLIIPAKVQSIGESAFSATKITSVSFEKGSELVLIDKLAFKNCRSLVSVNIPESVTVIEEEAFSRCWNLQTVEFGEHSKIEVIGNGAFMSCNILSVRFGSTDSLYDVGDDVFTNSSGTTKFRNVADGSIFEFNLDNKALFSGSLYTRYPSTEASEPLCKTWTVTLDYGGAIAPDTVWVHAGKAMERPAYPEVKGFVVSGWYANGILWDFGNVVESDLTLVVKYTKIESGKAEIEAVSGSAEIDFGKEGLDSASVSFSDKASIDVDKNGCSNIVTLSMFFKGNDRYQVIVQGGYDGVMTITLPYDPSKGVPEVYQYADGVKTKMTAEIDSESGVVIFKSAKMSSNDADLTYGIEYVQPSPSSSSDPTLLIALVIVAVLVVIGIAYYAWKH